MMHKNFRYITCRVFGALLLAFLGTSSVFAVDYFWQTGSGDWSAISSWSENLVPEAAFEEVGVINNGGTAMLSVGAEDTAGLRLGDEAGDSGTLQILSGGSINFVDSTGEPQGFANIGLLGTGVLEVQGGGSFSTTELDVNEGSNVIIGSGSGSASVASTGAMYLNGTTAVHGNGHSLSAAGNVFLEGQGAYTPLISASGISTLNVGGAANLGGELAVDFSGGFTPTAGDSWDLIDAGSVAGTFATLNTPQTNAGEVYRLRTVSGGTNGQLLQLQLAAVLQLTVDWDSGAMSISSPSGAAVAIDGYSILSDDGSLSTSQWSSLEDQAVPGWFEALPTANGLNELNANAGGTLAVGITPQGLGAPFAPVVGAFGTPTEDIEFEYTTLSGEVVQGIVQYTGERILNNLLLTVDPSTGEAQLKNSSQTTISIDGYSILSSSGSLLPSNGNWLSLEDQNEGDWVEANPSATEISELELTDATTLLPGQGFSLGTLFEEVSGEQDLVLEFVYAGESETQTGLVIYDSINPIETGDADFNGDGDVDGGDFLAWQRGFGTASGANPTDGDANGDGKVDDADLTFWQSQYGGGSSLSSLAAAVPEPSSLLLLTMCGMTFLASRKRSARQ